MAKDDIKVVSFRIDYIGTNPPTLRDVEKTIGMGELDEEGICTAEEIEPIYEVCEFCNGTGNEGTMTNIDCGNCGGSGWIKKEE